MELRTLRYFLTVAHEENISRAAEYLHLTQPTLSRQLMDLEKEIGKTLFLRGKRRITLTEEGLLLRKRASEIIDLVDKTEAELTENTSLLAGDIHIGAGETDTIKVIAKTAKKLGETYPDIHYHIFSGDRDQVKERLDKGLVDFGLIFGDVDHTKYNSIPLPIEDTWGVLMRRDSPLAKKKAICPEDLYDKRLFLSRQASKEGFLENWFKKPIPELDVVGTYSLIFNASIMVSNGLGYAFTLDKLVNVSGDSELCFLPCNPPLKATVSIVWKKYQVFSKPCEKFLETLTNDFIK